MFISRIAHVALGVADVEQAIAFYGDLLGLDVLWRGDDHVYLATGTSTSFELELGPYETGLDHFAFYVRSPEALDEASQRLKDAGIAVGEAAVDEPGLGAGIAFVLPSGFAMELVTETEPHGFENSAAIAPAHYAATGPLPLRHVTLLSPDIRADATFLIEQLGFRITDSWRPSEDQQWMSTFARVGDDHHDLALLPPNRPEPQLHHFAFAVPQSPTWFASPTRWPRAGWPSTRRSDVTSRATTSSSISRTRSATVSSCTPNSRR